MTSQAQPTPRDAIIQRVQKLRKMTEASGATESEAQTAITMIARLMAEYGLTESETQLKADAAGCITDYFIIMQESVDEWRGLGWAISKLYPTVVYASKATEDILGIGMDERCYHVKFFGFPADVTAAVSTLAICVHATVVEAKAQKGARARMSFRLGMIERLVERIKAITQAQAAAKPTGTSLVVLKDQLVRQEFDKVGPRLSYAYRPGRRTITIDPTAKAAGRAAGDRVDLGQQGRMTSQPGPARMLGTRT